MIKLLAARGKQFCGTITAPKMEKQARKYSFPLAQQANLGLDHLTVEVSRTHTTRLTQPVGLLWTSDQLMVQAATYVTRNEHNRWTSMPSVGFAPVIPASEWRLIYAVRLWNHQDQPKNIYSGNTRCHDNDRLINEYIITTNVVSHWHLA